MGTDKKNVSRSWKTVAVVVLFFAAAAVAVYFTYYYPPASHEDTAGTIGAVKKYRIQQISENDILLAGREAQKGAVRLDAFLNDAVKLQSMSLGMRDLASRLQSREGAELGKKSMNFTADLGNLQQLIGSQSSILQQRAQNMGEIAEFMNRRLGSRSSDAELANLSSELAELSNRLASVAKLDAKAIGNLAEQLDSKMEVFKNRKLSSTSLENAEAELASLQQELASNPQLESSRLEQMGSALKNYDKILQNRSGLENRSFANLRSYVQSMALESRVLANAEAELGIIRRLSSSAVAENMANGDLANRLASASDELANNTSRLASGAVLGMKQELASFVMENNSFQNLQSAAMVMSRSLESKGPNLEAKGTLKSRLEAFGGSLDQASRIYGAQSLGVLDNQLVACAGFMESSRTLQSQILENVQDYMTEARGLANGFALEHATKQSLDSKFGNLQNRLENSAAGSLDSRKK